MAFIRNSCVWLKDLLRRDAGQDLAEYAFIILLVAVALVASVKAVGPALIPFYNKAAAALSK